jgi:hypothetical protein
VKLVLVAGLLYFDWAAAANSPFSDAIGFSFEIHLLSPVHAKR